MSTEKNSNNTKPNIDYQIEITTQTLERNLGFISNCDNKASIILTAVGVLLTIILTSEGLASIKDMLKKSLSQRKKRTSKIIYIKNWNYLCKKN